MARGKSAPVPAELECPPPMPLTTPDGDVLIPSSEGTIVKPSEASHQDLGELLRTIRDHEDQLKAAKKILNEEVLDRMDRNAEWTLRFGKGKLTAPSPRGDGYKGEALRANLLPLVKEGVITEQALDAAVREDTDWKPMKGGIKKLLAAGDERVARAIELSAEPDERPRSVRVEVEG